MLLRCLKAEIQKCRRSPVWLAFLVLPIFPAILGTGNYLGNLEALDNGWYSLWSQHTLFSSMFFLPALLGVFCAWQWRLEHTDHNWNSFLTAPVPVRDLYGAKLILASAVSLLAQVCIGVCSSSVGRSQASPIRCRWNCRSGCSAERWAASRSARYSSFSVWYSGLCPTSGFWSGGRYSGPDVHRTRIGICLPILPAVPRDAGQHPLMELNLSPFILSASVYTLAFALFSLRYLRRRNISAE